MPTFESRTIRSPFPSAAEVEANTPPQRDRSLDFVRLFSLVVVIAGHGIMLLVTVGPDSLIFGNLLSESFALQASTWLLQVLPLFFFAGAAAGALGWRRGAGWGAWLMRRAQRLYRPVFFYVAAWIVMLIAAKPVVPQYVHNAVAGLSIQLLWFIGIYVVVLAFVPALARITRASQLGFVVGGLVGGAALIDAVRLNGGPMMIGYVNILVWLIPAALGVGYVRGLLARRWALRIATAALGFDVVLVTAGPYDVSLVTIPGQQLSNMTPPSLLLAGHTIVLSCLFVVAAPWCARAMRHARLWWFVAIGNRGAMTLYLWHMPALLIVSAVSHVLGHDRSTPTQPGFGTLLLAQLVAFAATTAALFVLLQPLENRPIDRWDDAVAEVGGVRNIVVGAVVICAGLANLLAAKWGLAGPGVWCTGAAAAFLLLARLQTRVRRTDDAPLVTFGVEQHLKAARRVGHDPADRDGANSYCS